MDIKPPIYINGAVYPDMDPPVNFQDDFERADYVHRICTAFDFGTSVERKTFQLMAHWREIFDRFPVLNSPGYHALRCLFGWPEIPFRTMHREPYYLILDAEEGRTDPCEDLI